MKKHREGIHVERRNTEKEYREGIQGRNTGKEHREHRKCRECNECSESRKCRDTVDVV